MMRNKLFLAVLSVSALATTTAMAEGGLYVTGKTNTTTLEHSVTRSAATEGLPVADSNGSTFVDETDFGAGLGIGYEIGLTEDFFVAVEGFYNYESASTRNVNGVLVTDVDLNATYGGRVLSGAHITDKFSIYSHGGFTVLDYDVNNSYTFAPPTTSRSDTETGFSYGVGMDYKFTDRLSTFTEFTQISDVEFDGIPEVAGGTGTVNPNDLNTTSLSFGLKYRF